MVRPTGLLALGAVFTIGACVSTPRHEYLAAPTPVFDPMTFFEGRTVGEGTLAIDLSGHRHTHVVGEGHIDRAGTLVLVQQVTEGRKPPRTRTWRIRRLDARRYAGTLTDATGPVDIAAQGDAATISFTMKHGLKVRQWLYLQPGGDVVLNRMSVTKFGLPIASLNETITKRPEVRVALEQCLTATWRGRVRRTDIHQSASTTLPTNRGPHHP